MADRYSYIPVTGLFIMVAWGVPDMTRRLPHRNGILALLAGTVIAASIALTWHQLGYWRDNISLYRHTLQVSKNNDMIHINLGISLADNGDLDAAIEEYRNSADKPDDMDANYELGAVYAQKGALDAAIKEYGGASDQPERPGCA